MTDLLPSANSSGAPTSGYTTTCRAHSSVPHDEGIDNGEGLLRLQALIGASGCLEVPAVPAIIGQLDAVLESSDTDAVDIANVVVMDVGLTTRVLALVNSSVYALPQRIESVEQAVSLLGAQQLRSAAIAIAMIETFKGAPGSGFDNQMFWKHSLGVAMCSRLLGTAMKDHNRFSSDLDKLFLSGLLHDIGRAIVAQQLPEYYQQILSAVERREFTFMEAELAILGTRHTTLGWDLLQEWRMASEICEAARYHHNPVTHGMTPCIVHCANAIAHEAGFPADRYSIPHVDASAWTELQLPIDCMTTVGAQLADHMDLLAAAIIG